MPDFDRAIQLEPELEGAYFGRGIVYSSKRDWDRAIADYDKRFNWILNGQSSTYIAVTITLLRATPTVPSPTTTKPFN